MNNYFLILFASIKINNMMIHGLQLWSIDYRYMTSISFISDIPLKLLPLVTLLWVDDLGLG